MNVLVTGGSGFVGTNLVEHYARLGCDVMNIDIVPPRNSDHHGFWKELDIRDGRRLRKLVRSFSPLLIMHLAARTDLECKSVTEYTANTDGVKEVVRAASSIPNPPRIIFASSMLVCKLGYQPKDDSDYCPTTPYGVSKMIGEQIVKESATGRLPWTIVRPTSIWGPWFDVPYRNFFDAVAKRVYMHPKGRQIRRSYGFVLNSVIQLDRIASCTNRDLVEGKTLYLADYEPVELLDWANSISARFGVLPPREVPLILLRSLACVGDLLKIGGVRHPPLTSSRLSNLVTDAKFELGELKAIAGSIPHDVEQGVDITVDWMRKFNSK